MDISLVIKAVLAMAAFGILQGLLLGIAAKKFAVEVDPKVAEVEKVLPGTNCGACGFLGCEATAEAIIKGEAPIDACVAGGHEVAEKVAEIMGKEVVGKVEPQVAIANCGGGKDKVQMRYDYEGIDSCLAAQIVVGGPLGCSYGCLGFGDCAKACPFDALSMKKDHLPKVNEKKCTACGICVTTCPRGIMSLIPQSAPIAVLCNSKDKGKIVREACKVGCIACKICEKECPEEPKAIVAKDNLAVVDYAKCTGCLKCVEKCPTKCIINLKTKVEAAKSGVKLLQNQK